MAKGEDNLQRQLYKFQTTAEEYNMLFSVKNIELMIITKDPIKCKLVVHE